MARPGERVISLSNKPKTKTKVKSSGVTGANDAASASRLTKIILLEKKGGPNTTGNRVFAGETAFDARERRARGFANTRPSLVPVSGVQRGNQSRNVGILGNVSNSPTTRSGLTIN